MALERVEIVIHTHFLFKGNHPQHKHTMSVLCRVEWNNARCNMELAMALGDDIQ